MFEDTFISYEKNIENREDLYHIIQEPLYYQKKFQIGTTPWEIIPENFKISIEKIDELYFLRYSNNIEYRTFNFIGRMALNDDDFIYIHLRAECDSALGFSQSGDGYIFISRYGYLKKK